MTTRARPIPHTQSQRSRFAGPVETSTAYDENRRKPPGWAAVMVEQTWDHDGTV
jgi:hypothetical protein